MTSLLADYQFTALCNLSAQIMDSITHTWSATPIDLHVACPLHFYLHLTHGWAAYTPQRHRAGYTLYSMCTDTAPFYQHFPDEDFARTFFYAGTPLKYGLVASPERPLFALYSPVLCDMAFHFMYLPHPLPDNFLPRYRGGSVYRQRLYYRPKPPRHHPPTPLSPSPGRGPQ